jgi:hypothetical protein
MALKITHEFNKCDVCEPVLPNHPNKQGPEI